MRLLATGVLGLCSRPAVGMASKICAIWRMNWSARAIEFYCMIGAIVVSQMFLSMAN